jgi:beta propeller repeat protein
MSAAHIGRRGPSRWGRGLAAVVFAAALFIENAVCLADFPVFPICTATGSQYAPDVSYCQATASYIIVWQDGRNSAATGRDAYGYDMTAGTEFAISTHPAGQWREHISGNTVVWRDDRAGDDIYGYNLSYYDPKTGIAHPNGEFPICTASGPQDFLDVDGCIVVWADARDKWYDIYAYDLSKSAEFLVWAQGSYPNNPTVSGHFVAWQDQQDIWVADIADPNNIGVREICNNAAQQWFPAISGEIVVWQDNRNGLNTGSDIYAFDLSSETEFPVCTQPGDQWKPAICGSIVVWDIDSGIYGLDISDPNSAPFCISNSGRWPAISGNVVVWEASGDIYGAIIPEPATLALLVLGGLGVLLKRRAQTRTG